MFAYESFCYDRMVSYRECVWCAIHLIHIVYIAYHIDHMSWITSWIVHESKSRLLNVFWGEKVASQVGRVCNNC